MAGSRKTRPQVNQRTSSNNNRSRGVCTAGFSGALAGPFQGARNDEGRSAQGLWSQPGVKMAFTARLSMLPLLLLAERNKFSMENFVHLIFTSFNDILMCVENTNRKTRTLRRQPSYAALPFGQRAVQGAGARTVKFSACAAGK